MDRGTQTSAGVHVRPAGPDDAALLAQLGARLFHQTFAEVNTAEDMEAFLTRVFSPDAQRAELSDPSRMAWIAEGPGGIAVGYAQMRRGTRADGVVGEHPAEVQRIYVDRELHGRRVGEALMRVCIDQARMWKSDVLWLGVWERNPRAIAFYEKMGFRRVGSQMFLLGNDLQYDHVMARAV